MRFRIGLTSLAMLVASSAWAGMKPVAFRLASLPASTQSGQQLVLCAANIGTGSVDVTLEFINVKTGGTISEKTVALQPLGAGAAGQPCLTTAVTIGNRAPVPVTAVASSFAATGSTASAIDGESLIVGVAMVRKPLLSFREAQVTASIQVMAPDAGGVMRTVQTIPLSRTTHPSDGAPVNSPPPADSGHHK